MLFDSSVFGLYPIIYLLMNYLFKLIDNKAASK